jgi:hypothetical protein
MPVDPWNLLAWMADRESREPGAPTMFGTQFIQQAQAAGLATGDDLAMESIARAASHLKRLGYIGWSYIPTPNVDRQEPPLDFVDSAFIQRVQEIHVTDKGHTALAARGREFVGTQINISNSTVGQLALGDITNIDLFVILDATERALESLDVTIEEKEEARSVIQRMRQASGTVASSAISSVLGAALRQALGLP